LTLVELMVALVISCIVMLATGSALVFGHNSWHKAWNKTKLNRDSDYAVQKITCELKNAIHAKIQQDGSAVKIYRENDWIRFYYVQGQDDLRCHVKDQQPGTIFDGVVEYVNFELQNNTVVMGLKLKQGSLETHLLSTVMMRNYQETPPDDED